MNINYKRIYRFHFAGNEVSSTYISHNQNQIYQVLLQWAQLKY